MIAASIRGNGYLIIVSKDVLWLNNALAHELELFNYVSPGVKNGGTFLRILPPLPFRQIVSFSGKGATIPTRNWYNSGREFFTPLRQKVPAAEDFSGNFAELYGLGDAYLNKKSGAEDWSRSLRRFILPHPWEFRQIVQTISRNSEFR